MGSGMEDIVVAMRSYIDDRVQEAVANAIKNLPDQIHHEEEEKEPPQSRKKAARKLGVSVSTLIRMEARGEICGIRIAGRVLFEPAEIQALIDQNSRKKRRGHHG